MIKPRKYQEEAAGKAYEFIKAPNKGAGLIVMPTAAGKSICIAETLKLAKMPALITCHTKEILRQNFDKYTNGYGYEATIFSASAGKKDVSNTNFVTIGSVVKKPELFKHVKLVITDEAHFVNAKGGMYSEFLKALNYPHVIGYTATPYRQVTDGFGGTILKFLTRTRPRIFSKLIHYTQTRELFDAGYLSPIEYFSIDGFDATKIKKNSTGADYDDRSVKEYYKAINFPLSVLDVVKDLLTRRKNILIFTRFIDEAVFLSTMMPEIKVVHSKMGAKERDTIIKQFLTGQVRALANVGIMAVGVDFPELETLVIAKPTMSLTSFYQWAGRGIRPHPNKKSCWVVDMGDNLRLFGKIEDLEIKDGGNEKWYVSSNGRPLTNVYYER